MPRERDHSCGERWGGRPRGVLNVRLPGGGVGHIDNFFVGSWFGQTCVLERLLLLWYLGWGEEGKN